MVAATLQVAMGFIGITTHGAPEQCQSGSPCSLSSSHCASFTSSLVSVITLSIKISISEQMNNGGSYALSPLKLLLLVQQEFDKRGLLGNEYSNIAEQILFFFLVNLFLLGYKRWVGKCHCG